MKQCKQNIMGKDFSMTMYISKQFINRIKINSLNTLCSGDHFRILQN